MAIIADLCLDEYTDHGHCGVVTDDGEVDNDATLELYQRVALAQAEAGVDMVGPSGMMDGQVGAIRQALDANGHESLPIMAYSAKYASAEYGPFREAVDVTISGGGGNRKGYQQDPANAREAMAEVELDVAEGADIIMVKPALAYLDVIAAARARFDLPLAAYHVSGRIRDAQGRSSQRLGRRRRHCGRAPHRHQASRRGPDPDVPGTRVPPRRCTNGPPAAEDVNRACPPRQSFIPCSWAKWAGWRVLARGPAGIDRSCRPLVQRRG